MAGVLALAGCGGRPDLTMGPPAAVAAPTAVVAVDTTVPPAPAVAAPTMTIATPTTTVAAPTHAPTTVMARAPAASTAMAHADRITGDLSPKSVVASGTGLVFAQNMMYTHTVSVFRSDGTLATTISDAVDLAHFGITGHPGTSQGAPVEAAFTSDGRYAYVSNYSMYGEGFGPEGSDECSPSDGYDNSFVYRVDTQSLQVDQVIEVGPVPKYVAVTPDDRQVLVTNWCSDDLSIIDVAAGREVARVAIGRYPRGIAIAPDSATAYIAVMGGDVVAQVDLANLEVSPLAHTGDGPRHIIMAPDGSALFVTNNHDGTVSRVDPTSGEITHDEYTGTQPRSMAMSVDGTALYVVNYESDTVTKLRADDLGKIDSVETDHHPIGITYEPTTATVWVACYGGSILVFSDQTAF